VSFQAARLLTIIQTLAMDTLPTTTIMLITMMLILTPSIRPVELDTTATTTTTIVNLHLNNN